MLSQPELSSIQFVAQGSDPLERYTYLRQVLSSTSWERLSDLARARTLAQRVRRGQESDQQEVDRLRAKSAVTEVLIPIEDLMRPKVSSTRSDFADILWIFLIAPEPDREILAKFTRNEIARRWLAENKALENSGILIGVVEPEGKTDGPTQLTFQVNNKPVNTIDGALWVAALDAVGSGFLQKHVDQVGKEFQAQAVAGALYRQGNSTIRLGTIYVADVCSNLGDHVLRAVVTQGRAVSRLLNAIRKHSKDNPEIAVRLIGVEKQLAAFYKDQMQPLVVEANSYHRRTQPEVTNAELYEDYSTRAVTIAQREWESGGFGYVTSVLWYGEGFATGLWQGLGNLFTMGHQETKGAAVKAYKRGMFGVRQEV